MTEGWTPLWALPVAGLLVLATAVGLGWFVGQIAVRRGLDRDLWWGYGLLCFPVAMVAVWFGRPWDVDAAVADMERRRGR